MLRNGWHPMQPSDLNLQKRLKWVLMPLAWAYGALQALRRDLFRENVFRAITVNRPVISIGALTAGGAGKTPFVIHLANRLRDQKVAILSRGYGGEFTGTLRVTQKTSPGVAGDEPVLLSLSTQADVWVGRDRANLAIQLADRYQLFLLDDGYQHLRLKRALNVCLVSEHDSGTMLPAGFAREWREALVDADFVAGVNSLPDWVSSYYSGPVGVIRFNPQAWYRGGKPEDPPSDVYAFCGIARPERFYQSLSGLRVSGRESFGDHYFYSDSDLNRIWADAKGSGARALVTTAKDAIRISGPPSTLPLFSRDVGVEWISGEDEFESLLSGLSSRNR